MAKLITFLISLIKSHRDRRLQKKWWENAMSKKVNQYKNEH
jgi:hypothetical protein